MGSRGGYRKSITGVTVGFSRCFNRDAEKRPFSASRFFCLSYEAPRNYIICVDVFVAWNVKMT